jgi:hypothetical protein
MQPGRKSFQLERARNEDDLGVLGDPERWGSIGPISMPLPGPIEVYSPQLVRVQCGDLAARGWDLITNWELTGFGKNDTITRCSLEITLGVGQASRIMFLDLTASIEGWIPTPGGTWFLTGVVPSTAWEFVRGRGGFIQGTVQMTTRLPAAALAVRAVLGVNPGSSEIEPHTISGSFFVAVSPRSV